MADIIAARALARSARAVHGAAAGCALRSPGGSEQASSWPANSERFRARALALPRLQLTLPRRAVWLAKIPRMGARAPRGRRVHARAWLSLLAAVALARVAGAATLVRDGGYCSKDADCESQLCFQNVCAAPTCQDKVRNGFETGTGEARFGRHA